MEHNEHTKGMVAILLAALLWSTGGVFIKLITLDAFAIAGLRSLFAAIVFLVIFRKSVVAINKLTLLNIATYAGMLVCFVLATKRTSAANAIFLQFTAPIYVLIFEPLLLKTRLERINVLTIVVCFLGMALFFVDELAPSHLEGNVLALLSGVCFGGFLLGQRKNAPEYHAASIFWGNLIVGVFALPLFFSATMPSSNDLMMGMYLGIVQIGIAYAIFTYGLKRVLAVESALLSMIEPVLNPVWVFIGYGERPSTGALIGGTIILAAITTRTVIVERRRAALLALRKQH